MITASTIYVNGIKKTILVRRDDTLSELVRKARG
jgi:hypothetical protein